MNNRFLLREEYEVTVQYSGKPIAFLCMDVAKIVETWFFHYSDGTEEALTKKRSTMGLINDKT